MAEHKSHIKKGHNGPFYCLFCWSDAVFSTDIGPLLGGRIHDQLDKEVHPALDKVLNMAGGTSAHFSFPLSVTMPSGYCQLKATEFRLQLHSWEYNHITIFLPLLKLYYTTVCITIYCLKTLLNIKSPVTCIWYTVNIFWDLILIFQCSVKPINCH